MEIDRAWAENVFVTKANLIHERVHDPDRHYTSKGKRVFTSVPLYNDLEEYNLYGMTDCLELTEDEKGVPVGEDGTKYKICIVEYKPTKPKNQAYHEDDFMQVFAQKICVDYVFGGDCEAVIYYADVKKRIPLPVKESFAESDRKLKILLTEMRSFLKKGTIPPIRKDQKCSGCSMKDLCMPKLKKQKTLRTMIDEIERTEE